MQGITLIVVGKLGQKFLVDGCAEYAKRLQAFCNFKVVELSEESIQEKSASPVAIEKALAKEAEKILSAVPKGARIVPLCIEGELISSENLAEYFSSSAISGKGDIAFIIGSSHGLAPAVKKEAEKKLSISRMTFTHQMARLMITEQIYRAFTINKGVKYHK